MWFKKMSKRSISMRGLSLGWVGVALCLLSACASLQQTPEDAVRERATKRWASLIERDFAKAYELIVPSYRSVVGVNAYRSQFGNSLNWTAAEVVAVSCETDRCTATVRIDAQPLLGLKFGNTISTHVDETWLLEDGRWWFFQKL